MDYSSNTNIIVTVISIIKQYGRRWIIIVCGEKEKVRGGGGGVEEFVCCERKKQNKNKNKAATTHMKNSGDEGLSLVEPASRKPLLAPEPVSFSHLSL